MKVQAPVLLHKGSRAWVLRYRHLSGNVPYLMPGAPLAQNVSHCHCEGSTLKLDHSSSVPVSPQIPLYICLKRVEKEELLFGSAVLCHFTPSSQQCDAAKSNLQLSPFDLYDNKLREHHFPRSHSSKY